MNSTVKGILKTALVCFGTMVVVYKVPQLKKIATGA